MIYTLYILYSSEFDKHYTGFTTDLIARLLSHYALGNDWTAKYRPWKLIYIEEFTIKSEVLKREKWLKTGAGRDFIKTLQH